MESDGDVKQLSRGDARRNRRRARRRQGRADKQRLRAEDSDLEPWPRLATEDRPGRGLRGFDWWKALGSPRFVCAPMVNGSSLAFRVLVRRYGVDLAFAPMIDAAGWSVASASSRRDVFLWSAPAEGDAPLVAQLAGHEPKVVAAAAQDVAPDCDAVDLNCGCPQPCAELGNYGAFLLSHPDTIEAVVREVVRTVDLPMTVKIRKPSEQPEDTVALAARLEAAGASALTVHGRTRHQIGRAKGASDWDVVAAVKRHVSIPVVLNGGVGSRADAIRAMEATGCDAVMSAEALLERPTMFAEQAPPDHAAVVSEFLDAARTYQMPARALSHHMFILLYGDLQRYPDLLQAAPDRGSIDAWAACASEARCRNARSGMFSTAASPGPWYLRHRLDV